MVADRVPAAKVRVVVCRTAVDAIKVAGGKLAPTAKEEAAKIGEKEGKVRVAVEWRIGRRAVEVASGNRDDAGPSGRGEVVIEVAWGAENHAVMAVRVVHSQRTCGE